MMYLWTRLKQRWWYGRYRDGGIVPGVDLERPSDWQSVFLQSPVNGGQPIVQANRTTAWQFPRETWLQARLDYLRERNKTK